MELGGQSLVPRDREPLVGPDKGFLGSGSGLNPLQKRHLLPLPGIERRSHCRPAPSLVAIPIELSMLMLQIQFHFYILLLTK
jgi:hypothetical protein